MRRYGKELVRQYVMLAAERPIEERYSAFAAMVKHRTPPNLRTPQSASAPAPPQSERRLPWTVLGGKIRSGPELRSYLNVYQKKRRKYKERSYDMQRIDIVLNYRPTSVYIGKDEFDGYLVFYFEQYATAVLECPIVGNALYMIRGDWQTLARKSKAELLHDDSGKVHRIIHYEAWTEKLHEELTKSEAVISRVALAGPVDPARSV